MIKFEVSITRRHLYVLAALVTAFGLMVPAVGWAADRFTDVPADNVFHDDITWLADAGVTAGCNPPTNDRFCPGRNVTREQMAAFMHRLATNRVVDAATAVEASHAADADTATSADHALTADSALSASDADKLDGVAPTYYQTKAASDGFNWAVDDAVALSSASGTAFAEVAIDVPEDGIILVNASATMRINDQNDWAVMWIELDHGKCIRGDDLNSFNTIKGATTFAKSGAAGQDHSMAATGGVIVATGSHTATLCGFTNTGTGVALDAGLTALWMADGAATVDIGG